MAAKNCRTFLQAFGALVASFAIGACTSGGSSVQGSLSNNGASSVVPYTQGILAVQATVAENALCAPTTANGGAGLGNYYYEIGNATSTTPLVSGQVGTFPVTFTSGTNSITGSGALTVGTQIAFDGTVPSPYATGTIYYVISAGLTSSTFTLSTTNKGTPMANSTANGSATAVIAGSVATAITRNTVVQLDSASKMIYGSFAVQTIGGVDSLGTDDVLHLHQLSGYNNMPSNCPAGDTVLSCLAESPGAGCSPSIGGTIEGLSISSTAYGALCTANVGVFAYNGANFQSHAALDLPSTFYNATANGTNGVTEQVNATLGLPAGTISYGMVLLAGGVNASPASVAMLLQKIIAPTNPLLMNQALGTYTVCTQPGGSYVGQNLVLGANSANTTLVTTGTTVGAWITNGVCNANNSPISQEAWQYSMGHWVETDPATNGDGAFSSPGAKGFVPWISADKTLYGIFARVGASGGVGYQSEQCGRLIRRAFVTGITQTGLIPTP